MPGRHAVIDRLLGMFDTAASQGHGSLLLIFAIGIAFGAIIQYTRVDKFEKIAGFAMLRDTIVPKMIFMTVGLAGVGLFILIQSGYATYHVKPVMLGGLILGAVLFGIAMAIMGKCPGTGPVSIAEGRVDVLVGAIGGIFGGLLFTLYYDDFKVIMSPDYGKLELSGMMGEYAVFGVLAFGIGMIVLSIVIPKREEIDEAETLRG